MNNYTTIVISLLVLVFIFYNQVRVRQVQKDMKFTLPIIMFVLGLVNFKNYINTSSLTLISWITIGVSLSILAVGMAGVRAYTVKLWINENVVYRRGTWLTILLWIVSIGLHAVLNKIGNVGESTSLIYFSITFTVQKLIVQNRTRYIFNNI